jgi:hypothetical protein
MVKRKSLTWAAVVGMVALAAAPAAWAGGSASGSQNAAITVAVTVDPDVTSPGKSVTGTGTITNNSATTQRMTVRAAVVFPDRKSFTKDRIITLAPGKSVTLSRTVPIPRLQGKGMYTLTVFATTVEGTSSATVKIDVR